MAVTKDYYAYVTQAAKDAAALKKKALECRNARNEYCTV